MIALLPQVCLFHKTDSPSRAVIKQKKLWGCSNHNLSGGKKKKLMTNPYSGIIPGNSNLKSSASCPGGMDFYLTILTLNCSLLSLVGSRCTGTGIRIRKPASHPSSGFFLKLLASSLSSPGLGVLFKIRDLHYLVSNIRHNCDSLTQDIAPFSHTHDMPRPSGSDRASLHMWNNTDPENIWLKGTL